MRFSSQNYARKNHPDQPEWMSHVNATVLKVKLSMSIISISSIHLLQTFVNASKIPEKTIMWEVIIHFSFLISAIAMAYTDKILYSTSHKIISTQSAVKIDRTFVF